MWCLRGFALQCMPPRNSALRTNTPPSPGALPSLNVVGRAPSSCAKQSSEPSSNIVQPAPDGKAETPPTSPLDGAGRRNPQGPSTSEFLRCANALRPDSDIFSLPMTLPQAHVILLAFPPRTGERLLCTPSVTPRLLSQGGHEALWKSHTSGIVRATR